METNSAFVQAILGFATKEEIAAFIKGWKMRDAEVHAPRPRVIENGYAKHSHLPGFASAIHSIIKMEGPIRPYDVADILKRDHYPDMPQSVLASRVRARLYVWEKQGKFERDVINDRIVYRVKSSTPNAKAA